MIRCNLITLDMLLLHAVTTFDSWRLALNLPLINPLDVSLSEEDTDGNQWLLWMQLSRNGFRPKIAALLDLVLAPTGNV